MKHSAVVDPKAAKPLPFVIAWALLLALGAISLGISFLPIGIYQPIAQFSIAALQVATMFILFMRLKGPPTLKWVFASGGFIWLLFLFGLSMTDYGSRRGWPGTESYSAPAPLHAPAPMP